MEIVAFVLFLITILFVLAELVSRGSAIGLVVLIFTMAAFMTKLSYVDERLLDVRYKQFRDNVYPDYSKDRNYQHWLLDNPKEQQ